MVVLVIIQVLLLFLQIILGFLSIKTGNDFLMVLSYVCFGLILSTAFFTIFR